MPKALRLLPRYGHLTVLNRVKGGVMCRCDCGTEKKIIVQNAVKGRVKSCGCMMRVRQKSPLPNHKRPEYGVWAEIKRRCLDPNRPAFKDYGGRGITVCERWLNSFPAFLADMGPRPSRLHSLDRINNAKGYEPSNCRWATKKEQSRNTRRNRLITYRGETLCVSAMCEKHKVDVDLVWQRIHLYGWTVADAIELPSRQSQK